MFNSDLILFLPERYGTTEIAYSILRDGTKAYGVVKQRVLEYCAHCAVPLEALSIEENPVLFNHPNCSHYLDN